MCSYHGGKQKLGKKLSSLIYSEGKKEAQKRGIDIKGYCEPFVGMCSVFKNVHSLFEREEKIKVDFRAGDINESLILMWKASQKGWEPPTSCSKDSYFELKNTKGSSALKGFIGYQYSFSGQYFMGYRGIYNNPSSYPEARDRVMSIGNELKDVQFTRGEYNQFSNLKGFVIYCDPPYRNSKCRYYDENYRLLKFDYNKFDEWIIKMSEDNIIFVSEYNLPDHIEKEIIFSKELKLTGKLTSDTNKVRIEKLYKIKHVPEMRGNI